MTHPADRSPAGDRSAGLGTGTVPPMPISAGTAAGTLVISLAVGRSGRWHARTQQAELPHET